MSCEIRSRPGSVLVQKSGRVDDDMRITALDAFYGKDGRKGRYIGEVLGIEEKVPEIPRELNGLRSGHVSMFSRRNFLKVIRRF